MQKVAPGVFDILQTLPTPQKYRSRVQKWAAMRRFRGQDAAPFAVFRRERSAKFLERVGKGPACEYRWEAWRILANGESSRYSELKALPTDEHTASDIEKDVLRTFGEYEYFKAAGRQALTDVLCCLAKENPEVGYCQGINFVVGLLLIVSGGQEAETFAVYSALRKERDWCGLYVSGFPKVWELTYQWRVLFKQKDEALYRHFKAQGVVEGLWLTRCVMTLFAAALPLPLVIRLWDAMLIDDNSFFLKTAWTLIDFLRPELVGKDLPAIAETMRGLGKRQYDIEKFVRDMRRVNIGRNVLERGLEKQRKHAGLKPAEVAVEV